MFDIDKHLIAYHDGGNDYRYVFSKEEVEEIKQALELYESALKNEDGYLATMCERKGYYKCADDFVNACKNDILCQTFGLRQCDVEKIAERLKESDISAKQFEG